MSKIQPSKEAIAFYEQGEEHFFADTPNYAKAERCFRLAIDLAPDWGEPFVLLAGALEQQDKMKEACDVEREAINRLPGDPRPLMGLGFFLLKLRRYDEAVTILEEVVNLKSHYGEADARLALAEAYEGLGQLDKAAILWKHIVTMKAVHPSYNHPIIEAKQKLTDYGMPPDSDPKSKGSE
ncbi:MAG: tetratricopeptide repeat protein [Alphaproteobacteria bacterium]|nr:MAG: tetratricopeptide repeat protein [Alphaproteobacteria bacterium]